MQLLLLQESPGNAPMNRLSVVFWRCRVSGLRTCTPTSVLRGLCTKPYTRQLSVGIQPSKNRFPCLNLYGLPPRRSCSQGFGPLWQNKTLQNYLQSLMAEHRELSQTLNLTLKEEERKALTQRHTELSSLSVLLHKIHEAESEARELEAMFADLNSREEEELLQEEQGSMIQNIIRLQEELLHFLVPHEKYDMNDAILEVVSGRTTGGDICQQFTGEVFDMYRNYAQYKSWSFEILNYTPNDYGGLHHAAARVIGEGVYKRLKYEGGIHRVQRIPEVGLSSRMQRIHTGTMTVIVLPQPDEIDVKIDPKELRIDTFRAKGAGGQHVNTTDSAVRIVHIPTGISVECQQERSQIQNRDKAMKMLRAKLHGQSVKSELSQRQSSRRLQVGTRDQSDRIRTYNFTQDRLTDHRISYEIRNLREFLNGEELLEDLIDKIHDAADTEALLEVIKRHSSNV
ncbi:peptide chain release factor 1, mitochondrial isoform X1 [Bufo bufo]|uniref:peptide chain release factor 1, mitochondrial isoform X1 n=2 Tax=Bufo bufo TaxID=8384 RepID=UPI001ABEA6E9|nr:peptide chain release factor 1, mitochondrial isoform X1 [Bufo bufo]